MLDLLQDAKTLAGVTQPGGGSLVVQTADYGAYVSGSIPAIG